MIPNKKILSMVGIFFGVAVVFFGLLVKDSSDGSIVISNSILKNFYISNRNLEEPVFIKFDDLTDSKISLIRDEFIKREVLKREALKWGLDKVDPLILSRLAQLGEQTVINNLAEDDISENDLLIFYNLNKNLYTEDPKITFSHIFFRPDQGKILENLNQYIQSQDPIFFKNFISNKISMFPYQKNYAQRNSSFISGHFSEKTAAIIFSFSPSENWQGPIESPFGYHILKVSSLTTETQKNFEEVRSLIKERVKNNKRKENLRLELDKKISSYNIIEN
jgi:hypothetical protein